MVGINFQPVFWSFYEVENEVSHNDGTFKVLDLSQTTPPRGGGRTSSYVKKYFRLIYLTTLSFQSYFGGGGGLL